MKHRIAVVAAAWLLAGCTGQSEGFLHLRALAQSDNVEAQITLAHAYADPAAFPGRGPTQPNGTEAAKWCYVAMTKRPTVADKACADVLARVSPHDRAWGQGEANDWLLGPDYYYSAD